MIKLSFVIGGSLRKVLIKDRIISMASQETGFVPIKIDLDRLEKEKERITKKMGDDGLKLLREISNFKTENEMAKDIIVDFQKSGWRMIKRENGVN